METFERYMETWYRVYLLVSTGMIVALTCLTVTVLLFFLPSDMRNGPAASIFGIILGLGIVCISFWLANRIARHAARKAVGR